MRAQVTYHDNGDSEVILTCEMEVVSLYPTGASRVRIQATSAQWDAVLRELFTAKEKAGRLLAATNPERIDAR